MPRKKLPQKAPCPCGSGKKYGRCCHGKDFEYLVDDDGTIFKSIPVNDELAQVFEEQKQKFVEKFGRQPEGATIFSSICRRWNTRNTSWSRQ